MSTYATIGRNVGDEPMSSTRWALARADVRRAIARHAGPVVTTAEGFGEYEGTTEATYVVVGAGSPADKELAELRAYLAVVAAEYGQEAIALTVAPVDFVEPSPSYATDYGNLP